MHKILLHFVLNFQKTTICSIQMAQTTTQAQAFHQSIHRARMMEIPPSMAQLVKQSTQELKLLAAEVNLVEREITEFNRYYYAEVGALYEQYKQLKIDVESDDGEELALLPQDSEKTEEKNTLVSTLSKKVFRRVAKICHPDKNQSTQSEFFIKLNDAYKANDLSALLLLEQRLYQQTHTQSTRFMEEQLDMIERAKEALEEKKNTLINSPAYKLRQKIFWAKMGGQDLMAQIKNHLKRQISLTKHEN